ncbi:MAG: nitroreductase family protein [Lachnospiraceae bacterium]|nr:nitroreductase family protein [Lachnospiraceae bacterium]
MVQISTTLCTGCGKCADNCSSQNIFIHSGKAQVRGGCFNCGQCVAICPQNAVSIPEYDMEDVKDYEENSFRVSPDILLNMIKFRRSIRNFKNRKLTPDNIRMLVQAGRYTATASNRQDCRFIIVQDKIQEFKQIVWDGIGEQLSKENSPLEELRGIYLRKKESPADDGLFFNAPAVLCIACEITEDAALAAQNLELTANAMGLGVLFNGWLNNALSNLPDARKWLHAEDKHFGVTMLAGYPAVRFVRTAPRREADFIIL